MRRLVHHPSAAGRKRQTIHSAPAPALAARGFLPVWHCKSRPCGMDVRKSASQPPGRNRGGGCFRLSRLLALDETIVTVSPHPGAAKARPQGASRGIAVDDPFQPEGRQGSWIRARRDASSKQASKQASKHLPAQAAQAKTRQPQTPCAGPGPGRVMHQPDAGSRTVRVNLPVRSGQIPMGICGQSSSQHNSPPRFDPFEEVPSLLIKGPVPSVSSATQPLELP
jgi:hypothetical protein